MPQYDYPCDFTSDYKSQFRRKISLKPGDKVTIELW